MSNTEVPYSEFVAKLIKPGASILMEMTPSQANLMHMAVGVAGETGELTEAFLINANKIDMGNVVEEIGDLEFFLEGLRAEAGIERGETLPPESLVLSLRTLLQCLLSGMVAGTKLLDAVKKNVIYQKPLDRDEVIHQITLVEAVLESIRLYFNIERDNTLIENRCKLAARYDKLTYSNEAAQARADKQ